MTLESMTLQDVLNYKLGSLTLETVFAAILLLIIGILIVKILMGIVKRILKKTKLDDNVAGLVRMIIRVILYAIVFLLVADYLGIPITSLLAVLSIVGLAVSLAIQDTLANVFSGILLLAAKTFSNGDYVQIGSLEGTVTKVDLMNTYLRTADNKHVRIPNKDVQAAAIVNFSHEPIRRVEIRIGVSYDAKTEDVKTALLLAAERAETVLDTPAPFAGIFSYQASNIEYVLQAWSQSQNYWASYYALTEGLRETFAEANIEISYDHVNVHMLP